MGGNGPKRVQMGDYGLKLWENGALTLISSFRPVPDRKTPRKIRKQIRKSEKSENIWKTPDKPH